MSERNFNMRLRSTYEGDTNTITSLEVEHRVKGEWQPLDLGVASPGFDIFVYAVFACQHQFFRVNCAERKLALNSAEGNIVIGADKDWNMETLQVHFSGQLGSGQASPDDIDAIVSRMKQCPVSRNIREVPVTESTVTLN
ncbi:MAG: hypothetical protein QNL87_08880 [Gammaproteobacteria bacterium]|nr:hypothetical protein [Gammaproteobacteria bacterium]